MKYCPYCGASVLDDTVSFCSECGKNLNFSAEQQEKKQKPKGSKKTSPKSSIHLKKKKPTKQELSEPETEKPKADDGYDGYYDDIVPTDTGKLREGVDWILMKKIGLVATGMVIIICLCVAAMYFL